MFLLKPNLRKKMLLSRYSGKAILLRGFTLIEIMITVLIIAILAAIMTPQFTRYVEKGRGEEGKLMLKSIRAAEKIYKSDNTTYTNNMNNLIPL